MQLSPIKPRCHTMHCALTLYVAPVPMPVPPRPLPCPCCPLSVAFQSCAPLLIFSCNFWRPRNYFKQGSVRGRGLHTPCSSLWVHTGSSIHSSMLICMHTSIPAYIIQHVYAYFNPNPSAIHATLAVMPIIYIATKGPITCSLGCHVQYTWHIHAYAH